MAKRSFVFGAALLFVCGCTMNSGSSEDSDPLGPDAARSVFAALGDAHPFQDYAKAENEVGWRILRSLSDEWENVGGSGGIIETFPEVGLPQVRVTYAMKAKDFGVVRLIQAAHPYSPEGDGTLTDATIGIWSGQWYESSSQVGFIFPTSEVAEGRPVVARVFAKLDQYSADELRSFIRSLGFGDERR